MAFDGITVSALVAEIDDNLKGGRINKIAHPENLYRRRDRLRTAGRKNRSIQRESVHRRSGAGQHCV